MSESRPGPVGKQVPCIKLVLRPATSGKKEPVGRGQGPDSSSPLSSPAADDEYSLEKDTSLVPPGTQSDANLAGTSGGCRSKITVWFEEKDLPANSSAPIARPSNKPPHPQSQDPVGGNDTKRKKIASAKLDTGVELVLSNTIAEAGARPANKRQQSQDPRRNNGLKRQKTVPARLDTGRNQRPVTIDLNETLILTAKLPESNSPVVLVADCNAERPLISPTRFLVSDMGEVVDQPFTFFAPDDYLRLSPGDQACLLRLKKSKSWPVFLPSVNFQKPSATRAVGCIRPDSSRLNPFVKAELKKLSEDFSREQAHLDETLGLSVTQVMEAINTRMIELAEAATQITRGKSL
ncbi:hypothetical protein PCASD_11219 [Puccinia coronata f. sp. avenae]|uniref:Uncharacterized protein n=1 Tax=Puccinia coronata f. sp. avenae TaxID=200324 RepID=A0A2N5UBM5_9BASI|nr:hypothetical protein PCASD_11219 [Puccinia coronata f. sp. avenae]